jgi:modulator of FtsH protease HflK
VAGAPPDAGGGRPLEGQVAMPWKNNGGGWQGGGGRGPWGQGPGGGGGPRPPSLEELLRKSQDRFKGVLPSGGWGGKGVVLLVVLVIAFWMLSGFYRVDPDEQGVVLRFGQYVKTDPPGLRYHLPAPIETAVTPKVTRVQRVDIGFRPAGEFGRSAAVGQRDFIEESLMLTGDENIVDIHASVFWTIKDAGKFLFGVQNQERTVKAVAESVIREIVGKTPIQTAQTEGRQRIEEDTRRLTQGVLDYYNMGISVQQVTVQKVDPPNQVIEAFRDVQRAKADKERARNEAEAYANDIIPRARGEAERLLQEAKAYKQEVLLRAQGEAQRFISVYDEFKVAKDVTRQRLYLETMEEVLRDKNKVIIGPGTGQGVVPYLPLPELQKRKTP